LHVGHNLLVAGKPAHLRLLSGLGYLTGVHSRQRQWMGNFGFMLEWWGLCLIRNAEVYELAFTSYAVVTLMSSPCFVHAP
jgi:hypothetical protein